MYVRKNYKKLKWYLVLIDKNYLKTKHWEYEFKMKYLKLKINFQAKETILQL